MKMEKQNVALITGITGQDGSYLAEFLLKKGYEVHGIIRRSSSFNTGRIDHLNHYRNLQKGQPRLILHYGDLTDSSNLLKLLASIMPNEIYNLAAQSHVKVSFEMSEYTADVDGIGPLRLLEAILSIPGLMEKTKFYQASTSELYGGIYDQAQNETTPFYPKSPYSVAKLYSFWIVKNYREAYGLFGCNGILFNHESPRRGETFVTKKITKAVANIKNGKQKHLELGNLNSKRDWGHAKDYVEAMYLMLQQDCPDDYVIATNETHSIREFVELSFREVGIEIEWVGQGIDEIGINKITREKLVSINEKYYRPTEVNFLLGDYSKAKKKLGWEPKITFYDLIKEMVHYDLNHC